MKKFLSLILTMTALSFAAGAQNADNADAKPPSPPDGQGHQGGGPRNFDPQRMQQMILDRVKENLGMTSDEWNSLKPLVEKVFTLSRETRSQGPMGFGQGRRRGGESDKQDQQPTSDLGKAAQALQKLLENENSTTEEVQAAVKTLRDARKKANDELTSAKAALVQKLTPRQEAKLVLLGFLD